MFSQLPSPLSNILPHLRFQKASFPVQENLEKSALKWSILEFKKRFKNDSFLQQYDAVFQGRVSVCCTPISDSILLKFSQLLVFPSTCFYNTNKGWMLKKDLLRKAEDSSFSSNI